MMKVIGYFPDRDYPNRTILLIREDGVVVSVFDDGDGTYSVAKPGYRNANLITDYRIPKEVIAFAEMTAEDGAERSFEGEGQFEEIDETEVEIQP